MRFLRHPPLSIMFAVVAVLAATLCAAFMVGADDTPLAAAPHTDEFFLDAVTAYRAAAADTARDTATTGGEHRIELAAQLTRIAGDAHDAAEHRWGAGHRTTVLWDRAMLAAAHLADGSVDVRLAAADVGNVADDLTYTVIGRLDPFPTPTAPPAGSLPAPEPDLDVNRGERREPALPEIPAELSERTAAA